MVVPIIGGSNGGSRLRGDQDIRHEEAEYGRAVYCNATDSGPLRAVQSEAGDEGVSAVVVTGWFRFGEGEEEGSGGIGIGRRGGDRQGGGNAPRNDDGPGMSTGVKN